MHRLATPLLLLLPLLSALAVSLPGCVGDQGEAPICSEDGATCRIFSDDPSADERLDVLQIVCESQLRVTGSFVPGIAQPEGQNGWWPVGTWTITPEVEQAGCAPQAALPETMVYEVEFDEETTTIGVSFPSDPPELCTDGEVCCDDGKDNDGDGLIDGLDSGCRLNLKISTEGDGLCHGSMDHYATDNSVWSFRPTLQEDGSLSGIGTYALYRADSF